MSIEKLIENETPDLGIDLSVNGLNLFEMFHEKTSKGEKAIIDDIDNQNQNQNPNVDEDVKNKLDELKKKKEQDEIIQNDILSVLKDKNKPDNNLENQDQNQNQNQNQNQPENNHFKVLYDYYVENNIWQREENFEPTEENFLALEVKNREAAAIEIAKHLIKEKFESNNPNSELAADFLQHLQLGGDPRSYIELATKADIDEDALKSEDALIKENEQRRVYFEYWRSQGLEDDLISKKFTSSKLKENLDDEIEFILPLVKKQREAKERDIVEKTTSSKIKEQNKIQEFNSNVIKALQEKEEVYGIPVSKEIRNQIYTYMYKPTVKLENGRSVPQFLVDREKLNSDPIFTAFTAMAAMQVLKSGKIDLSEFSKVIKENQTESLKSKLDGIVKSGSTDVKSKTGIDYSNVERLPFLM